MPNASDSDPWDQQGRRMDGLFRVAIGGDAARWTPNTDIYETKDGLVVRMELAGAVREDLSIEVANRILVVRGARPEPPADCCPGRVFRQAEVEYGPFSRTVPLPRWADTSEVDAQYRAGFLTVRIRRAAEPRRHKVRVQVTDD